MFNRQKLLFQRKLQGFLLPNVMRASISVVINYDFLKG